MPVIRDQAWNKLAGDEQAELHQLAYAWYDEQLSGQETKDAEYLSEGVHHALASANIRAACKHATKLGLHLQSLLLYRESLQLQQQVADRIPTGAKVRFGIVHIGCPEVVDVVRAKLRERFGDAETLSAPATPVIATHLGIGAWGLAYMVES